MACIICAKEDPVLICEITEHKVCHRCCLELQIDRKSQGWKDFFDGFSQIKYQEGDPYSVDLYQADDYYSYTLKKCLSCDNLIKDKFLADNKENTEELIDGASKGSFTSYSYRGGTVYSQDFSLIPYKAIELINRKGVTTSRDYLELGEMNLQIGENKLAIEVLLNSLKLEQDGYTCFLLAKAYHRNQNYDQAVDYYYCSIRTIHDSNLLFEKKKDEERIKNRFKNISQRKEADLDDKDDSKKIILKRFEQELKDLERDAYRELGTLARIKGELERAVLDLKKALRLDSSCNITLLEMAFVNFLLGKDEKVIEYVKELVKKNSFVINNVRIACYQSLIEEYKKLNQTPEKLKKVFYKLKVKQHKGYYDIILSVALCLHALSDLRNFENVEKINEAETALSVASSIRPDDEELGLLKEEAQKIITILDNKQENSEEIKKKFQETVKAIAVDYISNQLETLQKNKQVFREVLVRI